MGLVEQFENLRYKQKPSPSGKSENEGIQRIPSRTSGWAGLILLFAEKLLNGLMVFG